MSYKSGYTGQQIDSAVGEVLAKTDQQMLAPILSDPAGQAVTAWDYFIYDGVLRKALQAISSSTTAATFTGNTYSEIVSDGGLNDVSSENLASKRFDVPPNGTLTIAFATNSYGIIFSSGPNEAVVGMYLSYGRASSGNVRKFENIMPSGITVAVSSDKLVFTNSTSYNCYLMVFAVRGNLPTISS